MFNIYILIYLKITNADNKNLIIFIQLKHSLYYLPN